MDMNGQFYAPSALRQVKYINLYPPYKTFRGFQGRSGRGGEEKNLCPEPGIETDIPVVELSS
jgi:hypothetical protein